MVPIYAVEVVCFFRAPRLVCIWRLAIIARTIGAEWLALTDLQKGIAGLAVLTHDNPHQKPDRRGAIGNVLIGALRLRVSVNPISMMLGDQAHVETC